MDRNAAKKILEKSFCQGWIRLVDEVFDRLPEGIEITSVYQKYGSVRFENKPRHNDFESFLDEIEDRSLTICERCGAPGVRYIIRNLEHTRCAEHSEGGSCFH